MRALGPREASVARDMSHEARELTQRGLEDYSRGRNALRLMAALRRAQAVEMVPVG